MEALGQYAISVSIAALVCGVVKSLFRKSSFSGILTLLCGLYLSLSFLIPLGELRLTLPDLDRLIPEANPEAAVLGQEFAWDTLAASIKQGTEAYILDKAAELGLRLQVQVVLTQDTYPVPESVTILGQLSAEDQNRLSRIIALDLGIGEENQDWIG